MKKIKIERDYYCNHEILYKKKTITLEPGVTVLVGCNGIGKSTLLKQINRYVKKNITENVIFYDNLKNDANNTISNHMFYNDSSFAAAFFCSSEGERIQMNLGNVARQIGTMIRTNPEKKEFWILFDAIDSGFSVDSIEDLKRGLFDIIFNETKDKDVYIIISANEYEMARGEKCFDVVEGRYISIKSYEKYRKVILKSRAYKDKRIEDALAKQEEEKDSEQQRSTTHHLT